VARKDITDEETRAKLTWKERREGVVKEEGTGG
jgi:hypothetical protein